MLLLNAVLTVRAGKPGSHAGKGWEHVTDAAIRALDASDERVVFLLWGGYARQEGAAGHRPPPRGARGGHPSPMNAARVPRQPAVQRANDALVAAGRKPVHWADTRLGE